MEEYKLVERDTAHELSEWDLNQLGAEGWILSAIYSSTTEVEVEYGHYEEKNILVYHFYRPKEK